MGEPTWWVSPAKLNLVLHITGRRDDGYHLLQSVFVPIDVCDRIRITARNDEAIARTGGLAGLPPDDDLAVRAALALSAAAGGHPFGVDLHIDKQIPAGAGLGGGSSNAGTVLVALNMLWSLGWPAQRLREIAATLGADVPFFIEPTPAWVQGIGEIIQPVALQPARFLVVVPDVHVSTADVFNDSKLTRQHPLTTIATLRGSGTIAEVVRAGTNDCQPVVCARHPEVSQALEWAEQFGVARMSGTGAAVFSVLEAETAVDDALATVPANWRAWSCRTWAPPRMLATGSGNASGHVPGGPGTK